MGSLALTAPTQAPRPSLAELLKLVVLPSKPTHHERTAEFAERTNQLVRNIANIIDDLISTVIDKRTADEFRGATLQIFPQYFAAMRALSDLAGIVLPKETIDRLSAEWFSELEADFRNLGPSAFGAELAERGLFTAWTLRKISDLAHEVSASPVPADAEADAQKAADFAAKALWTRLHVDVLLKAMHDNKSLYPGALEPIRDGLGMAVNTYGCIREWADMRSPRSEPEVTFPEWTEEDEELLADSMRDLDQHGAL